MRTKIKDILKVLIVVLLMFNNSVNVYSYELISTFSSISLNLEDISLLQETTIETFDEFIRNLEILEEFAYDYVNEVGTGKDPLRLVIKYIRTGVEPYNSNTWDTMAGFEDADFARYVSKRESEYNLALNDGEKYIKVRGLKNLREFKLPNGNITNIGRIFGMLDICYTNKYSEDYSDIAGLIGDIAILLSVTDQYGVSSTSVEDMVTEIQKKYFLKDNEELANLYGKEPNNGDFSYANMQEDLDGYYLFHELISNEYICGTLTELFSNYMTSSLTDNQRISYLIQNHLGNITNRTDLRDKVFEIYSSNEFVTVLENRLGLNSDTVKLNHLRKAVCYVVADYLCKNAGDYANFSKNEFMTVVESNTISIAPGITQTVSKANTVDGKNLDFYVATMDVNRDDVDIYTNYKNNDPYISYGLPYEEVDWQATRVIDQANAAQKRHSNPENPDNYIENFNVVAAINGSGFYIDSGRPGDMLVMEGVVVHEDNETDFFGIKTDGTAIIGTYDEYKSLLAKGEIREAISSHGIQIVENGKNVIIKPNNYISQRVARSAIGITKTGKVLFVVLDGREGEFSCGASLVELAQLMVDLGCYDAINLDGGGSSTFITKKPGEESLSMVNYPSDGAARYVSSSLYVVSTAPNSTVINQVIVEAENEYLEIGSTTQMNAKALNASGNVVEIPKGVMWTISDETIGDITQEGVFTAKANGHVVVNLVLDGEVIGSKKLFIFSDNTSNNYYIKIDRDVTNATTSGNDVYYAIDSSVDMVTDYTITIDMSKMKISNQLENLLLNDFENASVWNFLLQSADVVSSFTTIEPVIVFDKDMDVDISELTVSNEYFKLEGTTFDEETNTLKLHLRWVKQSKPIDPDTANPLCILSGIKLTPKVEVNWSNNDTLNIQNVGTIGYDIYLNTNELYKFSQKPENQETFGLVPFENTLTDSVERGGMLKTTYKDFSDEYTLSKAMKDGWVMENGGWVYYEDGAKYTGIKQVPNDGLYYDFGENGINIGQKTYTGDLFEGGKEYFANEGKFYKGWRIVSMKDVRYYDETTGVREVLDRKEIPSTCIEDGECTYTRANGEIKKIEYDDAGGHEYVEQADGSAKCSVCGHVRIEMSEVTVTLSSNVFTYTGDVRQPSTTAVTKDGYVLKKVPAAYPDYYSNYKNNIQIGTGTVTLTASEYYIYINRKQCRGNAKGSITLEYEIRPDLPTNIMIVENNDSVVLSWKSAKAEYLLSDNDANTDLVYVIYKVDKDEQIVEIARTNSNTLSLPNIYQGAQFKIGTCATLNGKDYESINLTDGISTKFYITVGTNEESGKPRLQWNDIVGATSYEVYRSTKENGTYSKVFTTENNSYTHTSAEEGKTYYYKVVARFAEGTEVTSNVVQSTYQHIHDYVLEVINPTCTNKGYTIYTCECSDTYKDMFLEELGHSFTNYVSNEDGTKTATCDRCDAIETVMDDGSKLPNESTVNGVYRIAGADRYDTAFKVADTLKQTLGVEKFESVIVANGTNFADALAGSYLSSKRNAPILMTDKSNKNITNLVNYIKSNLKNGGTVYILGGYAAVSEKVDAQLTGYTVTRLAGDNRYETNLEILKEAGITNEDLLVCTGTNFADSLSASSTGRPMLLVGKKMNASQIEFLKTLNGNKIYVVGGTGAVNTTIEASLKAYGEVERLAGDSRYHTSVMVAETFFSNPTSAVVALATNFPDGLSGGALAYQLGAPLLLTNSQPVNYKTTSGYSNTIGINSGYVLGGAGLVTDAATRSVFGMSASQPIKNK